MNIDTTSNLMADLAASIREAADRKIAMMEAKGEYVQAQLKSSMLEAQVLRLDLQKALAQNALLVDQIDKLTKAAAAQKPGKGEPGVKA